jgi:hypothetical protein
LRGSGTLRLMKSTPVTLLLQVMNSVQARIHILLILISQSISESFAFFTCYGLFMIDTSCNQLYSLSLEYKVAS